MKKVKATISFNPSLDFETGGVYRVRQFATNQNGQQEEGPTLELRDNTCSFVVQGVVGQPFMAIVAYVSPDNRCSPATPIQFTFEEKTPPDRPTNLRVTRVSPVLEVLQAPVPTQPEPQNHCMISVSGHENVKEGALGKIMGIEDGRIVAVFADEALNDGGCETNVYQFEPTPNVSVICPDQSVITANEFIADFLKASQLAQQETAIAS